MREKDEKELVRSIADEPAMELGWGQIQWLVGAELMPGSEQTFGIVRIEPGQRNPLHSHPNCEELLYVISGACDHRLGERMLKLTAGSVIRIPRGVPHWAKCTGDEPVIAAICFSSPDRRTDLHEDDAASRIA